MRVIDFVGCATLPCRDVATAGYCTPRIEIDPRKIAIVLISESAAADPRDDYYAAGDPFFARTTLEVFRQAGAEVSSVSDILRLGVYLTTALKCPKLQYAVNSASIAACAQLLGKELALFPNTKVYLLMGDVAIRTLNAVAAQAGEPRVIPSGPTYRLRRQQFFFRGARVLPSYLQAGPSFFIEKGKHRVIAEDIRTALDLVGAL
jgi:uracil-DNA glycosylase